MNRRDFLTRALAAVPVIVAGEALLELLAPRRTIVLPPRGGWPTPPSWIEGYNLTFKWAEIEQLTPEEVLARRQQQTYASSTAGHWIYLDQGVLATS